MSPVAAPVTSPDAQVAAARTRAGLLDLSDRGVMSLVGPDARRFCNGMFTNNVRDVPVGVARASAMVDDKARIQGLIDLWCVEAASFLAVLEGVTPEAFEARYGKYIIFDDVELGDESAALGLVGVQGPEAAAVLGRAGLPTPGEEGGVGDGLGRSGPPRANSRIATMPSRQAAWAITRRAPGASSL